MESGSLSLRRRVAASKAGLLVGYLLRGWIVMRHMGHQMRLAGRWWARSRETTNFNFDLTALNRTHLAWWVAEATGASVPEILGYFAELESDDALRMHVRDRTKVGRYQYVSDDNAAYGRRIGWYALVRALRPQHIVETGIDKGLGTCVLAAALMRNGRGHVTAIDTAPDAGWLVTDGYEEWVTVVVGDAARVVADNTVPVDLFVHDVHFTPEQECEEYEALMPSLGASPVILSDNAHSNDVLPRLAERLGWHFSYFKEQPAHHWYPGGGMGLAWPRS